MKRKLLASILGIALFSLGTAGVGVSADANHMAGSSPCDHDICLEFPPR